MAATSTSRSPAASAGRDATRAPAGPGLRERKKRELRQRLSDTATTMFLERGFQQVRVSEIAAACDVSEKTVFNYFPTKESLLFDRGDAIADALSGPLSGSGAVIEALLTPLMADLDRLGADEDDDAGIGTIEFINRFSALVYGTPSLRAAMADLFDRLAQLAAEALARATSTPADSPANQIAGIALIGLWRVQLDAMRRHAAGARSVQHVRSAVLEDLQSATNVVKKIL